MSEAEFEIDIRTRKNRTVMAEMEEEALNSAIIAALHTLMGLLQDGATDELRLEVIDRIFSFALCSRGGLGEDEEEDLVFDAEESGEDG